LLLCLLRCGLGSLVGELLLNVGRQLLLDVVQLQREALVQLLS
jgi:hypothetical protein